MSGEPATGYWYGERDPSRTGVRLLEAMRRYRAAETAMRKRAREMMHIGETDLSAVRLLLAAKRSGTPMSPKDLAHGLGITSASTTILLDRLQRSGHLVRAPHPHDHRAILVEATSAADAEVRRGMGPTHERMMEVAQSLSAADAEVVIAFLDSMRNAVAEGTSE